MDDADDESCVEHVWRMRAVDFTALGAFVERYCSRCGTEDLVRPDHSGT